MPMPEPEFRRKVQEAFDALDASLSDVDPDVAECEQAMGAMTITFADRSRCILSAQPSVRQLWVALAALGTAYHFNYDLEGDRWVDDKGRGIELLGYMEKFLKEKTGLDLKVGG